MGLSSGQRERLLEFTVCLLLNLAVFFLSKFFVHVSVALCVFGSLFNALWMAYLLLPGLRRIPGIKKHF